MKVLVTGGMGFVGTAIVRTIARNHRVTVADRLDFGIGPEIRDLVDEGIIESIHTDVAEQSDLHKRIALEEFNVVVHLASRHFIPACEEDPVQAYHDNVLTTVSILKHLPEASLMINFSSAAVYEPSMSPHCEDKSPLSPNDVYGYSKKHVEELLAHYARAKDLSILNIRLFNAVGPGETNPHILATLLAQLNSGAQAIELGDLQPERDFVHINDIAWAIEQLMDRRPGSPGSVEHFNIGSGIPIKVGELVSSVVQEAGQRLEVQNVAARQRKVDRPFLCADLSKLTSVLPTFKPMTIERWLPDLVRDPRLRLQKDFA